MALKYSTQGNQTWDILSRIFTKCSIFAFFLILWGKTCYVIMCVLYNSEAKDGLSCNFHIIRGQFKLIFVIPYHQWYQYDGHEHFWGESETNTVRWIALKCCVHIFENYWNYYFLSFCECMYITQINNMETMWTYLFLFDTGNHCTACKIW